MLKVIKKDGSIENFNRNKMTRSITNSGDTIKIDFNKSDLDRICYDVENILKNIRKDESPTSTYEIRAVIIEVLIKLGFKTVADSYYERRISK